MSGRLIVIAIAAVVFTVDRLTKAFLPVTKYCNTGAAFGLFQGGSAFLSAFSLIVIVSLLFYAGKPANILQKTGIAMIIGGAAGNLYDRVCYGYVIDFIKLDFIDFPVFNAADAAISIGAIMLLTSIKTPLPRK